MKPWTQQNQTQSELTWCPPTLQVHSSSKPGAPGRDSQTHTVTKYIKDIIISSKHAAFITNIHSSWSFLSAVVNKRTKTTFKRYKCSLIPVTSPARDCSASKQETSKRSRRTTERETPWSGRIRREYKQFEASSTYHGCGCFASSTLLGDKKW